MFLSQHKKMAHGSATLISKIPLKSADLKNKAIPVQKYHRFPNNFNQLNIIAKKVYYLLLKYLFIFLKTILIQGIKILSYIINSIVLFLLNLFQIFFFLDIRKISIYIFKTTTVKIVAVPSRKLSDDGPRVRQFQGQNIIITNIGSPAIPHNTIKLC